MEGLQNIFIKLDRFTKRYYGRLLLKGSLLFLALGLIFPLILLAVEYFLWLNSTGRLLLLILFMGTEFFLLYRYILVPIFYLIRIKKGIGHKEASLLIGKHFPEVGDKLYNLLDLAENPQQTELLLASIAQRSENLKPVPFTNAIDFKEGFKNARYLIIPLFMLGVIWLSGNLGDFFGTYKRVVNYDLAYEPPAPFTFYLNNVNLDIRENEPLLLEVRTEGEVRPENVYVGLNGSEYLMSAKNGIHSYTLEPPFESQTLYFISNGIKSRAYRVNVLKVPVIQKFELGLHFPKYLAMKPEIVKGTGNAQIPEGTTVKWKISGKEVNAMTWSTQDTTLAFTNDGGVFNLSRKIHSDLKYTVSTSNANIANFEELAYQLTVVRDEMPNLVVRESTDSINPNMAYYDGEATDDHKLVSISLVYYPINDQEKKQTIALSSPNTNFSQFQYTFPSGIALQENVEYNYYFEATDNDAIHGGKKARSDVFGMKILNQDQLRNKDLEQQERVLENLSNTLEKSKEQKENLIDINREQKEKSSLSFNDKNQIKDFLRQQEHQENLMQRFSKQLKENLEKGDSESELNKLLRERLERQEMEAKKNARLVEELNKISEKIKKDDLSERLEEIAKNQQNSERNLEQLLELTKRYYVTEKAAQLSKDLMKLSEAQQQLSESTKDTASVGEQEKLNKEFEKLSKDMEELKKDDAALKKPLGLKMDKNKAEGIEAEQKQAQQQLEQLDDPSNDASKQKQAATKASQKQRSAADKIKQLGQDLSASSAPASGGSEMSEDAEMLRQILDNLVTFSFKQEKLYNALEGSGVDLSQSARIIKEQQELKTLFEHVDDSLFALSLRRAELSEFVNEQITEVYYNLDNVLDNLAESKIYPSQSHQQYVLTASNSLADFLANILENMQENMKSGSGSGSGEKGFQLPDIIKGQGQLKDKMGKMGESGEGESGKNGQTKEGAGKNKGDGTSESGEGTKGSKGNGEPGKEQGNGQGSEAEMQQLYEIYKEQQLLRQQLQQGLQDILKKEERELAQKLIEQMEDFENDLLENGITQRGKDKANHIQHELMKLENAVLRQGNKNERQSNTNNRKYNNPITTKPIMLENSKGDVDILNRQPLPLQPSYQEKVKNYFRENDPIPF